MHTHSYILFDTYKVYTQLFNHLTTNSYHPSLKNKNIFRVPILMSQERFMLLKYVAENVCST